MMEGVNHFCRIYHFYSSGDKTNNYPIAIDEVSKTPNVK